MVTENSSSWINRIWFVALLAIPIAAIVIPMVWLTGDGASLCVWTNITGKECWGCGITRATVSVLRFQFEQAWGFNKLVVIVFPLLCWLWGREVLRVYKKIKTKSLHKTK